MPLQSQLVSVVLFLAIASQLNLNCYAAAKGSNQASKKCQQYGHSCLGGHGKRSSPSSSSASSSMPIPAFFSSSSSRVLPARSFSAGSGSGSPLSSTEQLYSFGGSPSSRPLSSSHFLSSSNNNKLPLVYTLLSAAFPSRKHQQLQQQPNWKSFQESSAVSSETVPESWAAAQAEQAEQYLVPLPPPVNGAPTDPDGGDLLQIREGLGSNFFSTGNFHRVPNAAAVHQPSFFQKEAETGKQQQQQGSSDWELPSPMKKAAGALLRFRRSLIAGGKVGATVAKGVGH